MDAAPLLVRIEHGVATLTLNRPEALNSLNAALRAGLVAALRELDARQDVAAIVLTGSGRAFCAGLDVKEMSGSGSSVATNIGDADIGAAMAALDTPIIGAINGLAVTGGFEITLACDMVIAAESAWFQDTHAKLGLLPGWGLSQRLPRVAGPYRAKEISLSARRVPATEAASLGFVNRIVPDEVLVGEAEALGRSIAQWPIEHVRKIKSVIDRGYGMTMAEALTFEIAEARAVNLRATMGQAPIKP